MKRHDALIGLSQDHHHALVLARRCASEELTWDEMVRAFEEELEPHFQIEERMLLPALGDDPLVDRTLADHAAIRAHVRSRRSLVELGDLLREHVRFEERELFERAQQVMGEAELAKLAKAWPKAEDR